MDIKDSYLHGTVGVVKSISVDADTLKYTLADKGGTVTNVVLPTATQSANGLLSKEDKIKLDNMIATQVANNLTLKINSGTVEDTSLYTYNGSAAKTLDIKNGSGIGFTNDAGSLQIYNTGVRSIATGTTNGTISVDTNGTTANVAVKGLGSAAYTASDSYVKWNPTTYYNITLRSKIEGGHVRMYYSNIDEDSVFGYGYDNTSEEVYITNYKKSFSLKLGESLTYRNNVIAYTTSDITGNAATADKLKTSRKLWGLDFDGSANVLGDMTGVGNITINATGNKDYFINFLYNSTPTYSWRLGYLGTGSGDANYFVIDSSKSSGGTWHRALQIGHETLDATFTGTVTAPTFKGNLAWSDITDKPTSYTPAAHTHNLLTWSGDVRSTATTPSDYKKTFKFVGIKDPDAVGLTTTIAGSYVSLFGWKGYPNNSGPKSWELASDNKDRIHVRSGAGIQSNGSGNENWSNWNTLAYITDNFPSNQINTLTDYTKATEASSIAATDSLNTALGKLEYKADVACDWITSVTATDTDEYINKWSEIVGFLDSVKEGTDILDEFVTRKTNLTITGLKTFETNTSSAIILKTSTNGTNINFICEVNGVVNSGYLIYRGNENYHITNSGWSKEAKLLHSNNYTSYINTTNFPGLNKTGTVTSVKVGSTSYSPSSGVVSLPAYPTSLKSPNAIKFKNTTGTEVVYDGSAAVDLTEGVYNAKQLDGNSETSYLRYRGEIDTSYVDLTDTTKNHANFKKPSPGMYAVSRTSSSEMFISFAMNAGSCSSLEFKVNYRDTSRLYIRKVIDSNRISGDWRGLAWHSDIPTKVSQLTNDSGFLTSRGYIGTTAVQASSTALDLTGITNLTMNGTYTNNDKLVIHSSGCIYPYSTSTRTAGMYGKYDSTKVGHVWSMGTDFKIADDGSSTNNMYGLVYFHTNWSNSATNNTAKRDDALITEVSNYAGGHQIAFVVKGQVKVALGDRVWSRAGFLKSGSSDNYVLLGGGGHEAITTSVTSESGSLITSGGVYTKLASYLPRLRMTNPDPGHHNTGAIPFILALKAAGTPLYNDPEFSNSESTNSVYVYNNIAGNAVTITNIADNQFSANSSGRILKISTSASAASPGRGGFVQYMNSAEGKIFCQIFRAKIPTGFEVRSAENSMGKNYKTYWMTDVAGTGKWEWYCRITLCGTEKALNTQSQPVNFGSGGHVYVTDDIENSTAAVTWYLSYCNTFELSNGAYDGLRTKYSDNADSVGGQHFNWSNNKNDHTYLWATSSNGQSYLVNRTSMSVSHANSSTAVIGSVATANADRHVWFSDSATETKRAYDDDFIYNPATNTLTIGSTAQGYYKISKLNSSTINSSGKWTIILLHPDTTSDVADNLPSGYAVDGEITLHRTRGCCITNIKITSCAGYSSSWNSAIMELNHDSNYGGFKLITCTYDSKTYRAICFKAGHDVERAQFRGFTFNPDANFGKIIPTVAVKDNLYNVSGNGITNIADYTALKKKNITASDVIINASNLIPESDNSLTLGSSSLKLLNVYATTFTGNATTATTASTINGFTRRATSNCTWGTLTASNGYTPVYWGDTASNGGIGFSDKDGKTYMQIDGDYYAQEGTKLVLHTGNYTSYVNTTNFPGLNSVGDITGVTAGNGLTGGGTSGSVTLNVGAGTGISVAADTVGINSTYQTYISNGNTAYGWGNHANAGYLTRRKATISPEGNAEGWYRTLQFTSNSYGVSNFILSIQRSYNSPQNEHYIFAISVGYNGDVSISQLSGVDGVLLITKIRVVYTNSAAGYFDFYIKSNLNGSTSYKNTYTIELYAGDGALQTPEIVTSAGGTVVEFTPTNGIKSNLGFTGNFIGNLTGNVTGNVSGSSGSCTGNAATATSLATTTIVSSKSLTLKNTEWTDTGYTFASLTTGTYAVQITSGSNLVASGIMSVYKNLADTVGDEIPLHVYGTATWRPYLRTYNNKLLISSTDVPSANGTGTSRTVTIKIARII